MRWISDGSTRWKEGGDDDEDDEDDEDEVV
jgi:hypothetical protein